MESFGESWTRRCSGPRSASALLLHILPRSLRSTTPCCSDAVQSRTAIPPTPHAARRTPHNFENHSFLLPLTSHCHTATLPHRDTAHYDDDGPPAYRQIPRAILHSLNSRSSAPSRTEESFYGRIRWHRRSRCTFPLTFTLYRYFLFRAFRGVRRAGVGCTLL